MASSFANPYARGPQLDIASAFQPSFGPANAYPPQAKPSSAPKTQGTPYQSYAQQGQAQSIPPQSQGTPYQAYSQPSKPTLRPASQTVTGDPQGSYVTAPASQRPAPFQMGAAQTPWGQSMDPFVERDAFINQLNQQRMQNQVAFNSGGMTDPTAGMTPGLDYQQAMQQAGLGGGAPSMAPNYGDSMIQRLNQAFGGQGDPFTFAQPQVTPYQPFVNQQGQQFQGTMSFAPGTSQAYQNQAYGNYANQQGYYQPQQQGSPSVAQAPYTPPTYSPVSAVGTPTPPPSGPANPYGPPVTDRPAPSTYTPPRTGIDANRSQFLQNKAAGRYENPAATYDDYVKTGLDNAVGQVLNSPAGYQLYNEYQYGDPLQRKAYGDRLKNLIYASASQQNVAPADDWMSKKTGKSAAEGKDQYFNDAMSRYAAKQSPAGKAQSIQPQPQGTPYGQLATSLPNTFKPYDGPVGSPWWELPGAGRLTAGDPIVPGYSFRNGHAWDMQMLEPTRGPDYGQANSNVYNDATSKQSPVGKAQSIQPPSKGMPYGQAPTLPPGTTEADIWQRYKDRNATPAPQVSQPTFTNRPWQVRS